MKILILEDLQLDGRNFSKGDIALLSAEDAEKADLCQQRENACF